MLQTWGIMPRPRPAPGFGPQSREAVSRLRPRILCCLLTARQAPRLHHEHGTVWTQQVWVRPDDEAGAERYEASWAHCGSAMAAGSRLAPALGKACRRGLKLSRAASGCSAQGRACSTTTAIRVWPARGQWRARDYCLAPAEPRRIRADSRAGSVGGMREMTGAPRRCIEAARPMARRTSGRCRNKATHSSGLLTVASVTAKVKAGLADLLIRAGHHIKPQRCRCPPSPLYLPHHLTATTPLHRSILCPPAIATVSLPSATQPQLS